MQLVQNGWIYFDILRGCYDLPQSDRLTNDQLHTRLDNAGYYESATTTGLWRHKWRPIKFVLIVDDFVIKYVRKQHTLYILKILEHNYEITAYREEKKFAGIDLAWYYDEQHAKRTCRIYMNGYIDKLLMKYGRSRPRKTQLSPQKHCEVTNGSKEQLTPEE